MTSETKSTGPSARDGGRSASPAFLPEGHPLGGEELISPEPQSMKHPPYLFEDSHFALKVHVTFFFLLVTCESLFTYKMSTFWGLEESCISTLGL